MAEGRKTALLVCPGRGTYNAAELGYLARHHPGPSAYLDAADAFRQARGKEGLRALDTAARFSPGRHGRGDNASALIHACTMADFAVIDREKYEIVAITGNSMGWYSALGCAGGLSPMAALEVVDTMGGLMQAARIGGQIVYALVDENWRPLPGLAARVMALIEEVNARPDHALYVSIHLGGMIVLAGNEAGLRAAQQGLPPVQGRFPLRLPNHAAFHTPLQAPVAAQGRASLPAVLFAAPKLPVIDGTGRIWWPEATRARDLHAYTLGAQVVEPYDFTAAIRTGLYEFAPDTVIVLGPGTTLGGAVAQSMIACDWGDFSSKSGFLARQAADPILLSMGRAEQRSALQPG